MKSALQAIIAKQIAIIEQLVPSFPKPMIPPNAMQVPTIEFDENTSSETIRIYFKGLLDYIGAYQNVIRSNPDYHQVWWNQIVLCTETCEMALNLIADLENKNDVDKHTPAVASTVYQLRNTRYNLQVHGHEIESNMLDETYRCIRDKMTYAEYAAQAETMLYPTIASEGIYERVLGHIPAS